MAEAAAWNADAHESLEAASSPDGLLERVGEAIAGLLTTPTEDAPPAPPAPEDALG